MFPVNTKILVVDDSNFARSHLKKGLVHLKYTKILECTNVLEAQKLLQEEEQIKDPVHLLITDLFMPDITGIEFIRWVRAQERLKGIPVIILTSSQEKTAILEAGKLGVSHYMIKPFDNATLRDKLSSAWLKHGQKYVEGLKVL